MKSFAVSVCPAAIFIYHVIKNTPSDAESREEQDDSKHKFVEVCRRNDGHVMAQFPQGCSDKHGREMKMKDLNLAEEGNFPCKLWWLDSSEREINGE